MYTVQCALCTARLKSNFQNEHTMAFLNFWSFFFFPFLPFLQSRQFQHQQQQQQRLSFKLNFRTFFFDFCFVFFYFHVCRLPYIAHFALIYFEYCNAKTKEIYVTISNIVISDCCLSRIFSLLPVPNLAQRFMHNLLKWMRSDEMRKWSLKLERAHVTHKPIERTNKKLESYESRWLCMAGVDSHAYVHYLWL